MAASRRRRNPSTATQTNGTAVKTRWTNPFESPIASLPYNTRSAKLRPPLTIEYVRRSLPTSVLPECAGEDELRRDERDEDDEAGEVMDVVVPREVSRVDLRLAGCELGAAVIPGQPRHDETDPRDGYQQRTDQRAEAARERTRETEPEPETEPKERDAQPECQKAGDHDPWLFCIERCERADVLVPRAVFILHRPGD